MLCKNSNFFCVTSRLWSRVSRRRNSIWISPLRWGLVLTRVQSIPFSRSVPCHRRARALVFWTDSRSRRPDAWPFCWTWKTQLSVLRSTFRCCSRWRLLRRCMSYRPTCPECSRAPTSSHPLCAVVRQPNGRINRQVDRDAASRTDRHIPSSIWTFSFSSWSWPRTCPRNGWIRSQCSTPPCTPGSARASYSLPQEWTRSAMAKWTLTTAPMVNSVAQLWTWAHQSDV